ncbi:hypothetical protein ANN_06679 [Periplaneta americana]|uniref:Uncharacterized protein n=1 Tax=Periplaneta americana TaxID=6978 RepID=A0ABQ8TEY6_PERAM|nr:hypothetical protein ANN_06679 [Periplaneta americana]
MGIKNPFTNGKPEKKWLSLFLKRHSSISKQVVGKLTSVRASVKESNIREWFSEIESFLKEEGYFDIIKEDPNRVFNANESFFMLCPKSEKVSENPTEWGGEDRFIELYNIWRLFTEDHDKGKSPEQEESVTSKTWQQYFEKKEEEKLQKEKYMQERKLRRESKGANQSKTKVGVTSHSAPSEESRPSSSESDISVHDSSSDVSLHQLAEEMNAELHALYSSRDIIRNIKSERLRWAGHVAHMGESRNAYSVLVGRLEGKRPLGRPRRRWEDNIKMDLREVGYDDTDWTNLAQNRN